ncbi:MAG: AmmeMemoRadiSam system radical SAM enzyme [Elusimicrobia bacterium]|nr:AmmeMemoRadiSam system radical SAM enzyme [Elusimicrobiota bacterium]
MTLFEQLRKYSAPAALAEKMPGNACRCLACAHKCVIAAGGAGVCKVRFNEGGTLKAPWGYISGSAPDPVEKKPFFHVLPGAVTLSFGMLGCNFKCAFCQNHRTSQVLRDPACLAGSLEPVTPEELASAARTAEAGLIVSTYNEPLITAEWSAAVFREARKYGIRAAYVSNGYASAEVLDYIRPHVDLYKADLKTFDDEKYRKTAGGKLGKVLKALEMIHAKGFWLEIVTLLIPGFNDGTAELEALAGFIAGLSGDIPWHVTAFYPAYKMTDRDATSPATLVKAREIGLRKGLKYVYTGNIPGRGFEDTCCPACGRALVRRRGFKVLENAVRSSGRGTGACPGCSADIAGVWS